MGLEDKGWVVALKSWRLGSRLPLGLGLGWA